MSDDLRGLHEAATRTTISRAAFELFRDHGFEQASIRAIAEKAGVAVQTIYSQFGSKAGLAASMADLVESQANIGPIVGQLHATDDPDEIVALMATLERRIEEGAGDVLGVLRRAAFSDPAIAQIVAMGEGRRRGMVEDMVTRLDALGALRSGLTVADAVDVVEAILAGLCRPRPVGPQPGRSPDDHERVLREQLRWLLLGRR